MLWHIKCANSLEIETLKCFALEYIFCQFCCTVCHYYDCCCSCNAVVFVVFCFESAFDRRSCHRSEMYSQHEFKLTSRQNNAKNPNWNLWERKRYIGAQANELAFIETTLEFQCVICSGSLNQMKCVKHICSAPTLTSQALQIYFVVLHSIHTRTSTNTKIATQHKLSSEISGNTMYVICL